MTFLPEKSLCSRSEVREDGEEVFAWQDLSGNPGDRFEIICKKDTLLGEGSAFGAVAIECEECNIWQQDLLGRTLQRQTASMTPLWKGE